MLVNELGPRTLLDHMKKGGNDVATAARVADLSDDAGEAMAQGAASRSFHGVSSNVRRLALVQVETSQDGAASSGFQAQTLARYCAQVFQHRINRGIQWALYYTLKI